MNEKLQDGFDFGPEGRVIVLFERAMADLREGRDARMTPAVLTLYQEYVSLAEPPGGYGRNEVDA